MAISQYFRGGSLIDAVTSHFTPDVVRKASSLVGESESSTLRALTGAVPSVLHGIVNMASTGEGGSTLTNLIRDGDYGAAAESVGSLFGGGKATNNMIGAGTQLLGKLFGNNTSSVTNEVAQAGGVKPASATKLMSLVAPLTLGVIGRRAAIQGIGFSGISSELLEHKSEIAAAAPSGISKILGTRPTLVPSRFASEDELDAPTLIEHYSERTNYAAEPMVERKSRAPWLRVLLAILLAGLGLWLLLRGRGAHAPQLNAPAVDMSNINLPGGGNLLVPRGSMNDNLAAFLAGKTSGSLPKTFVFDHLNFESASTQLTSESRTTVNNLAQILRAYPNAHVQLVGHTDNTGTPDANQTLSEDRANAVKSMLVNQGVGADRIAATGYGQARPVAPNDAEEGRARNRRIELNVINK